MDEHSTYIQEKSFVSGALPSGVRAYNERLLLTMIRQFGPIPGSELAKIAGLSAQTVSVILRKLDGDGLILRGDPQRGRVGKPSVPFELNPEGAFGFGLKLGRRSSELTLVDLKGNVRDQLQLHYPYPLPGTILDFLQDGIEKMTQDLPAAARSRIDGIGIAMPFDLWKWNEEVGAKPSEIAVWQSLDIRAEIARFSNLPVLIMNDATAGCYAETILGTGRRFSSYAYFFVGFFIGGGVAFNGTVYEGPHGNAGGMGPVRTAQRDGKSVALMDIASLHRLEDRIEAKNGDPSMLWHGTQDWSVFETEIADWIDEAAFAIAGAAMSACALIDFEAIVIDGAFPEEIRARLLEAVKRDMATMDSRGIVVPELFEGTIGANARAIGAAYNPVATHHFLMGSTIFESNAARQSF